MNEVPLSWEIMMPVLILAAIGVSALVMIIFLEWLGTPKQNSKN